MEYKESKHLHFLKRKIYTRYAGWQGCINILPYLVIRRNPLRTDWVDFQLNAVGYCGLPELELNQRNKVKQIRKEHYGNI